jgi:hypothetical protein
MSYEVKPEFVQIKLGLSLLISNADICDRLLPIQSGITQIYHDDNYCIQYIVKLSTYSQDIIINNYR